MSEKYHLNEDYGRFPELTHDELELIGNDKEVMHPLPRHREKHYGTTYEFQHFPEFGFTKEDDDLDLLGKAS